ncbi:apoptosis-stimulating of p53 protein 2a isoform X2 [Polyodon spathula]|uniref:apoptosis-stimulating of p53 protein 2a isoform X2 n=1 Tax=Polyodon spathula TaxID=7913 RepID=UPI001B7F630E|nr:apoptosis-stimulating of p53 protein 2a isoform X2 [Polyodon spathula]
MRYGTKMMPMFLTVYLSNNDQHFTEVPITPETTCHDVVELCKEPGETECHLAEMWRGSERAIADNERMLDVVQHWGNQRTEVRFFLRHDQPPSRESGGPRPQDQTVKKNGVKGPVDRRMENGVGVPRMDMTLSELQEMATRQQQEIDAQQQLLASKEQRLRYLKMHDQRQQQQASEQEKLQRLREIAENQEAKLKKVRALKGHVEQKRLSNGKLVEEIEQMNSLFQQKQRELVVAVSKVEELSRQLEMLKNGKIDSFHDNKGAVAELDRLYKELQLRNKLNQEQNAKLQQQRECLNKRNTEVAVMDKRVNELRDRLWKKKAALQHKENVPTVFPGKENSTKENQNKYFTKKIVPDSNASQQTGSPQSRVAAVGPYIQSSTVPRGPSRHELLIKPAYPDGTSTLPVQDGPLKTQTLPMGGAVKTAAGSGSQAPRPPEASTDWSNVDPSAGHGSVSTLPRTGTHSTAEQDDTDIMLREKDKKVRPFSMFESTDPSTGVTSTGGLRKNQSNEDLRDAQNAPRNPVKIPPPVPSKPSKINLSFINPSSQPPTIDSTLEGSQKPVLVAGTFPGKTKLVTQQPQPLAQHSSQQIQQRISVAPSLPATSQSHTLPLPSKQETPPAATVRPFTPQPPAKDAPPQPFHKPQTVAASSIYSMYTQQHTPGKNFQQAVQSTLTRAQTRGTPFTSVYGKPVIVGTSSFQQSQGQFSENCHMDQPDSELEQGVISSGCEPQETERIPRPLSPTKLLPFISNPYRHQSEMELDALRKKLYNAPRPLKKRSSITEPEGPNGPNIQKLLYQKTTLAAMETTGSAPFYQPNPAPEEENGPHEEATSTKDKEGPEIEAVPETGTSEANVIKEQEEFIPPPPPSHPAPIPEGLLESLSSQLPPGEEENDPSAPLPLEAYMEEYPPYPPPPYPITGEQENLGEDTFSMRPPEITGLVSLPPGKRTNLRKTGSERIDHAMRVKFNPLALLLDSSLEGEFDLVQRIIYEVDDPSQPNDEGITALHNAVCAGHTEIVKFLVQFGVNVNAADSDGWTPLHCAASCNNVQVCKFLVESGAAVFAATYSDMQTAAEKCEEMEEGYTQCSQFLYGVQEKMGIMNRGVVYGLWDYEAQNDDELVFREGDCMTTVRREDEDEVEWWWVRLGDQEGYVPRNLLGLYPRIKPRQRSLA